MRARPRRLFELAAVVLAAVAPAAGASCGGSSSTSSSNDTSTGSAMGGGATSSSSSTKSTGESASSSTGTLVGSTSSGGCTNGEACGDAGVCVNNMCCDAKLACGQQCCPSTQVCSFQQCATPGAACYDSTDCATGEYCEYSLGTPVDGGAGGGGGGDAGQCQGGAAQLNGKCLPKPPECAGDAGPPEDGGAITCFEKCDYHPVGAFSPALKYSWGGDITFPYSSDVMMTPIVIEMDDDDCDGKVTANDIPEILFTTFTGGGYTKVGTLHCISIIGGQVVEKWTVDGVLYSSQQLAGGDLDGVPGAEVVGYGADSYVYAFKADGSQLWKSSETVGCTVPSIADLDGDGVPEVVCSGGILDGATGVVKTKYAASPQGMIAVSDVDGDGLLDIVTPSQVFHSDGSLVVNTGAAGEYSGIGDFDLDGVPEVVAVDNTNHAVSLWHVDPSAPGGFVVVRAAVDMNAQFPTNTCPVGTAGATHGGGPPTVADFNGDGVPDIGLAGGIGYVVFDGKKLMDPNVAGPDTILWSQPTVDCSSAATGSSVFDFDGDGKAEVIYSDQQRLRIYDGTNGDVLWDTCNTTGTLIEYPVIADVDNDGHADIVAVSNAYAAGNSLVMCNDGVNNAQSGVRVFGDSNGAWVRTRRVWNEHAYHITNVNEDGTIPKNELPNWTQPGLDNFRQNKQPGAEFSAPDAIASVAPACPGPNALVATVRNIGEAPLPAGVVIGFYEGTPPSGTKLGSADTSKILYPAESETVSLTLMNPDKGLTSGTTPVYVVVDDTTTPHPSWHECNTDNNLGGPSSAACTGPK